MNETFPTADHVDEAPPSIPLELQSNTDRRTIGKYQVVGEIGEGGMGRVYRAFDPELKRLVAIKVLRANTRIDDVNRFRGEAELVASLEHANIVRIFDIAMDENSQPYIVLEYVDGGTLADRIRQKLPSPRESAQIAETLALAVQAAHERQIIHRDLKPSNVLVTKSGDLKVTDFGLGKRLESSSNQTQSGDVFGTPAYMPPEQASGDAKAATAATDVYSLGAILYELLTSRPPFAGSKPWDILAQVRYVDPVSPTLLVPKLPRDLATITLKCLEKSQKARYQTAAALAHDLRRWLNNEPISARPTPWWERQWRRIRRRPKDAILTAAFAFLMLAGIALIWKSVRHAEEKRYDEDLRRIERKQEAVRHAEAAEHSKRLNTENESSIAALKSIRELLRGGYDERSHKRMLDALSKYYRELVERKLRNSEQANQLQLADETAGVAQLIDQAGYRADALKLFEEATRFYRRSMEGGAETASINLADTLQKMANINLENGDYAPAGEQLEESRRLLGDPGVSDLQRTKLVAIGLHEQGLLLHRKGGPENLRKSVECYLASIRFRKRMHDANEQISEWKKELARGHGFLGDVYLDLGLIRDADGAYWQSHRLREDVHLKFENGVNGEAGEADAAKFQLARSWSNLARFQARHRAFGTAQFFHDKAQTLRLELTKDRPVVSDYQLDLAHTNINRAFLYLLAKDSIRAKSHLDSAKAILAQLSSRLERQEKQLRHRSLSASILTIEARYLVVSQGRPDPLEIQLLCRKVLELLGPSAAAEQPLLPVDHFMLSATHALLASLQPDSNSEHTETSMKELRAAIDAQYRDLHPDDIQSDVAFANVRGNTEFKNLLLKMEDRPSADLK